MGIPSKRLILLAAGLAAVLITAAGQGAAPADSLPQLLREMRELRIAVLEELAERQSERMEAVAGELERVHRQQARLDEAARAEAEEAPSAGQDLSAAEADPQQRAQLELAKASVDAEAAQRLVRQRKATDELESMLLRRLGDAKERQNRLTQSLTLAQQAR
jgi:hypothetical protein